LKQKEEKLIFGFFFGDKVSFYFEGILLKWFYGMGISVS
jgi:hypothetical protein